MIATVTLNASVDKTYLVPSFPLGKVTRVEEMLALPGGKGINVARVIQQLGERPVTTGFVGGSNGNYIIEELNKLGIDHQFIGIHGESRVCLNIIDRSNQTSTELLEQGPVINQQELDSLRERVSMLAQDSSIIVFSGSIPTGVPTSIYGQLIEISKREGAKVFLDTSGDALLEGVKALPFLIKPNEDEVERIIGKKLIHESDLYHAVHQLMDSGIQCVVVSLGAKGSVAGYGGQLYRIRAPRIEAVNTVGCGDSFVAGMATALFRDYSILEGLRFATATGTANALTSQAGLIRKNDIQELLPLVEIERIKLA